MTRYLVLGDPVVSLGTRTMIPDGGRVTSPMRAPRGVVVVADSTTIGSSSALRCTHLDARSRKGPLLQTTSGHAWASPTWRTVPPIRVSIRLRAAVAICQAGVCGKSDHVVDPLGLT
jgi:hypothetical protein